MIKPRKTINKSFVFKNKTFGFKNRSFIFINKSFIYRIKPLESKFLTRRKPIIIIANLKGKDTPRQNFPEKKGIK